MLYFYNARNEFQPLPPIAGVELRECDDPMMMSVLGKISPEEARRRMANDHKAFVAYFQEKPAAFGWMAMGKAQVGELNHTIILPLYHRYLWNFRTLEEFRGLGIYPRLLQFILDHESNMADCFWVLHAPENKVSEKGILKAGFSFAGHVSVRNMNEIIFDGEGANNNFNALMAESLGFNFSRETQATCWKCSSPYLADKKKGCCCEAQAVVCNEALFH
jgi:GNAT superfamily N-acetyltransferase